MSMREDRRHFAARTYDDGERIVDEAEPDVLRQLDQVGSASTRATTARPDRRASLRRTGSTETEGEEVRGHIRKRAKGWAYVIDLARDPATGKRKQKWVSGFATENTAEKAMRQRWLQSTIAVTRSRRTRRCATTSRAGSTNTQPKFGLVRSPLPSVTRPTRPATSRWTSPQPRPPRHRSVRSGRR